MPGLHRLSRSPHARRWVQAGRVRYVTNAAVQALWFLRLGLSLASLQLAAAACSGPNSWDAVTGFTVLSLNPANSFTRGIYAAADNSDQPSMSAFQKLTVAPTSGFQRWEYSGSSFGSTLNSKPTLSLGYGAGSSARWFNVATFTTLQGLTVSRLDVPAGFAATCFTYTVTTNCASLDAILDRHFVYFNSKEYFTGAETLGQFSASTGVNIFTGLGYPATGTNQAPAGTFWRSLEMVVRPSGLGSCLEYTYAFKVWGGACERARGRRGGRQAGQRRRTGAAQRSPQRQPAAA
jgi:hypothetical protein